MLMNGKGSVILSFFQDGKILASKVSENIRNMKNKLDKKKISMEKKTGEELTEDLIESDANASVEEPVITADEQATVADEKSDLSELEIMTEKYNEINDRYLRMYSEFENYRKRTSKERIDLIRTAGEDIVKALLPVLDDFDRALKAMDTATEIEPVKEGVNLIHAKFKSLLQNRGLTEIESPVGQELDTDFHEAITNIPAPDESLKGKIVDMVEKGYKLGEKVVRYAKVIVGN